MIITYTINSLNAKIFGHKRAGGHGSVSNNLKNGTSDIKSQISNDADFGKCSRLIALSTTCLETNIKNLRFVTSSTHMVMKKKTVVNYWEVG